MWCAKLRGLLHERRIGHAGTLDPMATGVLPVFVGRATRAVEFAAEREKEYLAGLRLGVVTDTQDTTGTVLETHPVCADRPQVDGLCWPGSEGRSPRFPRCTPPSSGRGRSSTSWPGRARRWSGSPGPLPSTALDLLDDRSPPRIYTLRVRCSKGTYVRTLCHDIGQALGCGGALFSLRRTQSAGFFLDQAVTIDQVSAHPDPQQLLLPVDRYFSRLSCPHPATWDRGEKTSKRESFDAGGAGRCLPGLQPRGRFSRPEPFGAGCPHHY